MVIEAIQKAAEINFKNRIFSAEQKHAYSISGIYLFYFIFLIKSNLFYVLQSHRN